MQTKEFCVYNETRENFLSPKVTVIDTKSDPLKAVKALIEGLGPNAETGLWLNPLKSVPTVPRLSPYDLVYLDQDCRVMQGVALVPDDEAPRFDGQATSALLLPIHTFSTSQSHPGDQVIICSAEEMKHRPPRLPISATSTPASPVLLQATRKAEIHPPFITACASQPQTAIVPSDAIHEIQSPNHKKASSRIRFLRDIAHLRVHISISIAYAPSAESASSQTTQPSVEPANQLPAPGSSFKSRFLRQAPKLFARAREIVIPRRVRSAIATASASVAQTTRAATTSLTAECVAEWNVLKSCTSFCTEAFLRSCVRPTIAAVSELAIRATRACARKCQSWKVQYSNWAQEFMFRRTRLSDHTEAPPARRPAVRARSQQWLKARFLR
jgi:hypothetical protein